MKIYYRRQLPGRPPTTSVFQGLMAKIIGGLILLGLVILAIFSIPVFIAIVLIFVLFMFFCLMAGWIYLGYQIGFRPLWELTRYMIGWGYPNSTWNQKRDRFNQAWRTRGRSRSGQWER